MKKDLSFYKKASQNLIAVHHLKDLLARLQKNEPEILFFRGMSLIGNVYPFLGDREMLDVDILVRERDFARCKEVLKKMGLQEAGPGTFHKTGFILDLHTSFLNLSRISLERSCLGVSIEDVFKRSITEQLDGMEIKIPCPLHLFISTAIHLQSHSFDSEKGWEDLKRIKRYYGLSDKAILSDAQKMGAEQTLAYLTFLRPELFPSWRGRFSLGERLVLRRIRAGNFNRNFGDLLFLSQSKSKGKALKEIFFPRGISLRIICDRIWKCLKFMKDTIV
ncbi:MAG: hypothetical protein A2Z19_00965 [Deltaproteobacteria bacterium RBG_16_54_18]|nr:MAG: hypothetical protein A2Z19_00965 [Deltaproteobacteria bacterium RBG_16_54_18]